MTYERKRAELFEAEKALMEQRERVAALRRALPPDQSIPDHRFETTTLSGLFTSDDRPLIVYHFMYGKAQPSPCPMCSMWIDGFDAIEPHVRQRADLAVVAAAEQATLERFASKRGWKNIRLVGAGESSFKRDLGSEDADGAQSPMISVFLKRNGEVVHFYSAEAAMNEQGQRGIDLLSPVWNMFDLTPVGRGEWYPSLTY